ncbi:ribonuclease PH [Candidatus Bathyarchaeota archaeon]|nr:ribonuclease PH [Candidatus Bathyarchaeota archaeon]
MRIDGRERDEIRPVSIQKQFTIHPEGSVLLSMGDTMILANVSAEDDVPYWMKDTGRGWVTSEYAMLPRSTHHRQKRERGGRYNSRAIEISRLIGRALRPVVDLNALGSCTLRIDCEVLQADGGTRCASITAAYIALKHAEKWLLDEGWIDKPVITRTVAAVSVGIVEETPLLDLNYEEDSKADVDLNVAMTSDGTIIEIQGTAEGEPFSRDTLCDLLDLATKGINDLVNVQNRAI